MDLLEEISGLTNQEGVVHLPPHMVTRTVLNELLAAIFDNYQARAIWVQTWTKCRLTRHCALALA